MPRVCFTVPSANETHRTEYSLNFFPSFSPLVRVRTILLSKIRDPWRRSVEAPSPSFAFFSHHTSPTRSRGLFPRFMLRPPSATASDGHVCLLRALGSLLGKVGYLSSSLSGVHLHLLSFLCRSLARCPLRTRPLPPPPPQHWGPACSPHLFRCHVLL